MKRIFASAPLMFACATLFWAGNTIVGKAADSIVPAFTLSFWRWTLALLIITPVAWRFFWPDRSYYIANWKIIVALGITNVTLYNTLQYSALNWTSATNVGILSSALPIVIFFLSWVMRTEHANRFRIIGVIIATLGVLIVTSRGDWSVLISFAFNRGDGIMLMAIVSFGVYSVLLRKLPKGFHIMGFIFAIIAIGWLGVLPFYFWDLVQGRSLPPASPVIGIMFLYLAVFPSIVSQLCWFRGVELGGANLGGIFYNLLPVYASIMAVLFLHEKFTLFHLTGMILIAVGVYFATILGNRYEHRKS